MIPGQLALLLIKQKNDNKIFGEFEFEYFGDSDVVNKLFENRNHPKRSQIAGNARTTPKLGSL